MAVRERRILSFVTATVMHGRRASVRAIEAVGRYISDPAVPIF
jgi:hypothetical protein